MSGTLQPKSFYIGWDVGGWNCDKNSKSRDAIVIIDASLAIVGEPWRGNLRSTLNEAGSSQEWIRALFTLCEADLPVGTKHITLAIDTPLGFSEAFVALVTGLKCVEPVEGSATNPYLYRQTERYLYEHGWPPLSAVKDMIGSQATKGMHALAKFAPQVASCGVWTDGKELTAIEAYPSPCKHSALMDELLAPFIAWKKVDGEIGWMETINHPDKRDALICALIAYCSASQPDTLAQPEASVPMSEGWIWVPRDALAPIRSEKMFTV